MTASQELDFLPGNVKKAVGGASSGDLWMIQRSRIRTHPKLQPRDKTTKQYKERVRYLADLIKANGFDRAFPLKVYAAREGDEDVLYLVQGHRRLEAVDLAVSEGMNIEVIPCVTTDRGTTMEDLMFATITGNEGEPLTPIEKAARIRELMGCNLELDLIAKRLGYTVVHVKNLLSILEAPRDVRQMVQSGKVAASVAVDAVKEHGKQAGSILQAGLEVAKAKGKEKVTPKHLREVAAKSGKAPKTGKAAAEAPKAGAANGATHPALQRAAAWIAKEVDAADESPYLALIACTLELGKPEELQKLVNKLR